MSLSSDCRRLLALRLPTALGGGAKLSPPTRLPCEGRYAVSALRQTRDDSSLLAPRSQRWHAGLCIL